MPTSGPVSAPYKVSVRVSGRPGGTAPQVGLSVILVSSLLASGHAPVLSWRSGTSLNPSLSISGFLREPTVDLAGSLNQTIRDNEACGSPGPVTFLDYTWVYSGKRLPCDI